MLSPKKPIFASFRRIMVGRHDTEGFASLHPRLQALGLRPRHSTFQVGYLRIHYNTDYHKPGSNKHNIVKIRALFRENLW